MIGKMIRKGLKKPRHKFFITLQGEGNSTMRYTKSYVAANYRKPDFHNRVLEIKSVELLNHTFIILKPENKTIKTFTELMK